MTRTKAVCGLLIVLSLSGSRRAAAADPVPPPGPAAADAALRLETLTDYALAQNPRLAQAAFAIDAARGKALQAGLYPNPTVNFNFDELGDRQGPQGINTLPLVTQEIVTGGKLRLSRAAADRDVDQATLTLMAQRYALLGNLRSAFFDAVVLQRRVEILDGLVALADASVTQTDKLFQAKQIARLNLVQLEVERERLVADLESAQRELPGAYRKLAAVVGVPRLPILRVAGSVEAPLPPYDLELVQHFVLTHHPERRHALAGVEKARLQLRRERAEPVPNVTVGAGYVRQNQNQSDDWTVSVSVPLPAWNRNQGHVQAAAAQVGVAESEVGRVENDLVERLGAAFRDFSSAQKRAERYRTGILPKAEETYRLSVKAYQGGEFEYLRVLEAQRSFAQAQLEYVRALGDAWKAAGTISGLSLEDQWPPALPVTADGHPEGIRRD